MNVLAFFAHPDDETILAGGTMALLARNGARVHYLCATRGEGGEIGEPPISTPDRLGDIREKEMVCAVQALSGSSLTFLGYTDPSVGPDERLYPYSEDLTFLAGQVTTSIRQFEANAVITHGANGEYGHPAHVYSFQAALTAVLSLGEEAPLLYTVSAIFPEHPRPRLANQDNPAHLVLDVSSVREEKERAAMCHRTQHALFVRRASQEAGRQLTVPEVLWHVESLHRVHPPVQGAPDDQLARILKPYKLKAF